MYETFQFNKKIQNTTNKNNTNKFNTSLGNKITNTIEKDIVI